MALAFVLGAAALAAAWAAGSVQTDGTENLRHDGTVSLTPPADWAAQRPTAKPDGQGAADWTKVTVRKDGVPLTEGVTTALPPTKDEIERLLAAAPRYGVEIKVPRH